MLTNEQKERRVQRALAHKDDDCNRTVFSNETSYQLFRNTIRRWSKTCSRRKKKNSKKQTKKSWYGVHLATKVKYHFIRFEQQRGWTSLYRDTSKTSSYWCKKIVWESLTIPTRQRPQNTPVK
ncbi:unnamed protein product [Rotaria socialis]|uniref:Uncharacterized protein n=1 Tax=Rotaria socialis TaxID=392032 RepID=A0A818RBI5_9BILA|nr:unnamed protein product [Rotaria socialis]